MLKATNWITQEESIESVLNNNMEELLLNDMDNKDLQQIVKSVLIDYGTKAKLAFAEKAADIMTGIFTEYGFIGINGQRQGWVDYSIAAVYLHNLFTSDNDWTTVFNARKNLTQIFVDAGMPEQAYSSIFQCIEAQYGEKMPVEKCRVIKNSPMELMYLSIWFAGQLLGKDTREIETFSSAGTEGASMTEA